MSADIKLASLDEFKSLRKDIGFHFTSQSNIESIMNEGLRPVIGDNASGGLGQSAIPKTYISPFRLKKTPHFGANLIWMKTTRM